MSEAPYQAKASTVHFLRYLLAVNETGSIRAAAELAAVTQPTLSTAISTWEKSMGVTLFERFSRGVRPTILGEQVIEAAQQALHSIEKLEALALQSDGPFHGPLRLGMIPTVGPYAMPFVHEAIQLAYPDLELYPIEGQTQVIFDDLASSRLDLAMIATVPYLPESFHVEPVYHEPFLMAMPPSHAMAKRKQLKLDDLNLDELLLLDEGHCLRDQALEVCQMIPSQGEAGRYRASSLETLRQLVASGFGVTLLPVLATHSSTVHLSTCPLRPAPSREIAFIWRRSDPRHDAFIELVDAIRYSVPGDLVKIIDS